MKAKFNFLFLFAITAFFIASCQQNNTVTPPPSSCSYAPYSNGSEFVHIQSNGDTSTTVVTGDTVINGAACKILSQTFSSGNQGGVVYHYCGGGSYMYRNLYVPQYNIVVDSLVYLKDNLSVGDTWTASFSGVFNTIPITAEYEYSCVATGLTRTVSSQTFNNVVHVRSDAYATTLGIRKMIATTNYYFAEGVGVIETDVSGHKIVSYNIVP